MSTETDMNTPLIEPRTRGTIARPAIQCVEPVSAKEGCFLFTGDSHRETGSAVSPVFDDLYELFQWCQANGWKGVGAAYVYAPTDKP